MNWNIDIHVYPKFLTSCIIQFIASKQMATCMHSLSDYEYLYIHTCICIENLLKLEKYS